MAVTIQDFCAQQTIFKFFMTILKSYNQFDFTNSCLILKASTDLKKKSNYWSARLNKKKMAFYAYAILQVFC